MRFILNILRWILIIAESDRYDPIAVETAKNEIESRELSQQDLDQAQSQINDQKEIKKLEIEKRKRQEDKLKQSAATFFETINPIQSGIQTPEKIIRLTTLIFAGKWIYGIFNEFRLHLLMLTVDLENWDLSMVEYFFPLILLPLATILFWKRKKIGWGLMVVFLTYSATTTIGLFFMNLSRPSGLGTLGTVVLGRAPSAPYILALLFFGTTLWLICKESVRHMYKISLSTMFLAIRLTMAVSLIFMFSIIG